MYNEYDGLNFDERLQISEEQIRRRHSRQRFLRRNTELLQQELEFEDELLEENPELAQIIHEVNSLEIQAEQQGFRNVIQGESAPKSQNIWSKFFPGLGGK
ncbi:MAG: hypothetical protein AB3A66_30290 (plasmid) [Nodularia sp. CChRGM 3473]